MTLVKFAMLSLFLVYSQRCLFCFLFLFFFFPFLSSFTSCVDSCRFYTRAASCLPRAGDASQSTYLKSLRGVGYLLLRTDNAVAISNKYFLLCANFQCRPEPGSAMCSRWLAVACSYSGIKSFEFSKSESSESASRNSAIASESTSSESAASSSLETSSSGSPSLDWFRRTLALSRWGSLHPLILHRPWLLKSGHSKTWRSAQAAPLGQ